MTPTTVVPRTTVLVVDDEPQILRALRINLSARGYDVVTASTGGAALRAAAERCPDDAQPVVRTASFSVDLTAKRVTRHGADVHLTPTEWGMLEILVRNPGKLVGQEELLNEVWGPAHGNQTHYLRVYLAQLRRKLEDDPSHPKHLLTEVGMGYRFQQ
jgi:two-component system KDP operon response regulator KdpE